jgi:DNA transposition AAA+ family ATPase
MSTPERTGHHFLDLPDAQTIKTRPYALTVRAVSDLVEHAGMGLVHGDAGLGKSFAVERAVAGASVPHHWIAFAYRTTTRVLARDLLALITGVPEDGKRAVLERGLIDVLADGPQIVVVDEAQNLNHECIEYLRHLHDRKETQFTLLLAGGNGCWELLGRFPMLRSRLYRRIRFAPLEPSQVQKAIPKFHAIYRGANPELIASIDRSYCRGVFRSWAAFTQTAIDVTGAQLEPVLTESVVENAYALLGGANDDE